MRRATVVYLLVLLGLCAAPGVAGATPEERMLERINQVRADQGGLPPLRPMRNLQRSAGAFARWLVTHDSFAHRPAVSVTRAYPHCGEALAIHFSLAADIGGTLKSWMRSPTHRGLVMTGSMGLIGLGHASGRMAGRPRTIWVLQVARR